MRLPSMVRLAEQSRDVLQRFPWTMLVATVAAAAAIVATTESADKEWGRIAMVAALGLAADRRPDTAGRGAPAGPGLPPQR